MKGDLAISHIMMLLDDLLGRNVDAFGKMTPHSLRMIHKHSITLPI